MIVQHNLTAMNSNRQLGITTGSQAKSSEKLSSGYRINRAGDDAAGLKISEKMRSQVRGLNRASTNAQDGVSLIQTAEGALNEAHSILQRMNELAVQGANDTNENIDREAINEELDQLTQELDRISTTTQFNKQNLLDGSFQSKNLHVGANANQKIQISIDNMNAETLGLRSIKGQELGDTQKGKEISSVTYKGMTYQWDASKTGTSNQALALSDFKAAISNKASDDQYAQQVSGTSIFYLQTGDSTTQYATAASAKAADVSVAKAAASADFAASFEKYVDTANTAANGPTVAASGEEFSMDKPGVDSYARANATITAVQNAINKVSSQRSALGAIQNRLEHTIANLDNVAENTQAAESRIRDLDMASEMVEYSKNNILAQAGQSMLAQANQSTQGVLSLLQ
ncbi:MAG: flagellin [Lachnospiraceae bacterium]|nr:flagellin [Lachnospiraceae bacterium]